MRILIKAFLSTLIAKKARTALVLFSIAVSAAIMFANESFSRIVAQRFYEADVRWSGVSDFCLETKEAVGAPEWLDPAKLSGYGDAFAYAYQMIRVPALYLPSVENMRYFTMLGADIDEFNQHNPVTLQQGDWDDWTGSKVIIGKTYADLYHLKVGDVMRLELNNIAYDFTIAGVSAPTGLFLRELADGGFLLTPKTTLAQIAKGNCNLMFLRLRDRAQRTAVKDRLTADFAEYKVSYGIDDDVIAAETQNYVLPFRVSATAVMFMCMFIIFTAFNLMTMERIPLIGTLRSIGCPRRRINAILIAESAGLGALGGLLGCVLGVGVLQYIKAQYFAGEEVTAQATAIFGAHAALMAVGAAVLITTASAILPILRFTRTPIKNIILNDLATGTRRTSRRWIIGIILLAACAGIPPFLGHNFTAMIIGNILATGALVGLVLIVPMCTALIVRIVEQMPWLRQEIVLGVRNLRDNSSLRQNIQLFAAAIAIVAFMASIFNTMEADLLKAYERDIHYDVAMILRHTDHATLARLAQVDGVTAYAGSYQTESAIVNHGTFLNALVGIENADIFTFESVGRLAANQHALSSLNDGKNIITTNVLKDKLGLRLGDPLVLEFGNNQVAYTITGFVETNQGIGHVGYISASNFKAESGVTTYDLLFVKASAPADVVKNNILRALSREVLRILTIDEIKTANADKVIAIFKAINSYAQIALLVGIIGIINNLIASFLTRKRSFAMYRCVGMSKHSLNRMLITEAVTMGAFGVGLGLICALIMSATIPVMVGVFWGNVTVQLAIREMVIMGVLGILAMLAISVVPIARSHQLNLIETIKYE